MRAATVSTEVADVLWSNQKVANDRAADSLRETSVIGSHDPMEISESLVRQICGFILVPPKVMMSPMTRPTERLVAPGGLEFEQPFFALTRRMKTRWSGDTRDLAFKIGREITSELYYDVLKAEDEASKDEPFVGLVYAPFVLVLLTPISRGRNPKIGVMMRYSKRVITGQVL